MTQTKDAPLFASLIADLILERRPSPKRIALAEGGVERLLPEGAVIVAFACHLFDTRPDLEQIKIHPDGEHAKQFPFRAWLEARGFKHQGSKPVAGRYTNGTRCIHLAFSPGLGDITAIHGGGTVVAECKGSVINSRHSGQKSKQRRSLCEAVGLLMARPATDEEQIAVVPATAETQKLAGRLAPRARAAGIRIALIEANGAVRYVD